MQKKLKLKGIGTLSALFKGFIDGRTHAAELSGEPPIMRSAFISSRLCRYDELCSKLVVILENELSAVRVEADVLTHELDAMPQAEGQFVTRRAATATQSREIRRDAVREDKIQKCGERRKEIIRRLTEIDNVLSKKELIAKEELKSLADRLERCFCIYCRGALLRPISRDIIPRVKCEGSLEDYLSAHSSLKKRLRKILDKEEIRDV